jgi:hypothetical protein
MNKELKDKILHYRNHIADKGDDNKRADQLYNTLNEYLEREYNENLADSIIEVCSYTRVTNDYILDSVDKLLTAN